MKFTRRDWIWVATCTVLTSTAIYHSALSNRLSKQLDSLQIFEIKVVGKADPAGPPLPDIYVNVEPQISANQTMPLCEYESVLPMGILTRCVGNPPFTEKVFVWATGFQPQTRTFDSGDSRRMELEVLLKKSP